MDVKEAKTARARRKAALDTPTDLTTNAVRDIAGTLNTLLADSFALYLKTKNFHWHVSGPHFRDYHLLLDEQAAQTLAATDDMAERVEQTVRKLKGEALEDEMVVEQAVARTLKKASQHVWDRRPIVETIVLRL